LVEFLRVTVGRSEAGLRVERGIDGMYEEVETSGLLRADGLWARLLGGTVRVLLTVHDSVTRLLYPPVVAAGAVVACETLSAEFLQLLARHTAGHERVGRVSPEWV